MSIFFKKIILGSLMMVMVSTYASAAKIIIQAPKEVTGNGQVVTVGVFVDSENDTLSGIAGNLSFPSDLFDLDSIYMHGSVVSLWAVQPKISEEKYLDGRTHIIFEGIFPGGYSGVRGAYYDGVRAGHVFTITLTPKKKGVGLFVLDDIVLNSFSEHPVELPTIEPVQEIIVGEQSLNRNTKEKILRRFENTTLTAFITRDPLVNRNAWYLALTERESVASIDKVYVKETEKSVPEAVLETEWREVTLPHVLFYQDRSKYVHVKVVYSDGGFTFRTLPPVENFESNKSLSRILLTVLALLFVVYLYGKNALSIFSKK